MSNLVSALAGILFGLGLGIAGMTDPANVRAFLDIFGAWDPTLMFVMGGAIAVHLVLYRLIRRRQAPLLANAFFEPTRRDIDKKLLLGAGVFGLGWGIAGFCPGPGIVSLASGAIGPVVFVGAMAAGMLLQHAQEEKNGQLGTSSPNTANAPAPIDPGHC